MHPLYAYLGIFYSLTTFPASLMPVFSFHPLFPKRSVCPIFPGFSFFLSYRMFSFFCEGRIFLLWIDLPLGEHLLCHGQMIYGAPCLPFHSDRYKIAILNICLNILDDKSRPQSLLSEYFRKTRSPPVLFVSKTLHFPFIYLFITNLFTYLNKLL